MDSRDLALEASLLTIKPYCSSLRSLHHDDSLLSTFSPAPPQLSLHKLLSSLSGCLGGDEVFLGLSQQLPWSKRWRGRQTWQANSSAPWQGLPRWTQTFGGICTRSVEVKRCHLTDFIVVSYEVSLVTWASQGYLEDKDRVFSSLSLQHQCQFILLVLLLPFLTNAIKCRCVSLEKPEIQKYWLVKTSREMSWWIHYWKILCKASLNSIRVPQRNYWFFFCLQLLVSKDKQLHQGVVNLLPKGTFYRLHECQRAPFAIHFYCVSCLHNLCFLWKLKQKRNI